MTLNNDTFVLALDLLFPTRMILKRYKDIVAFEDSTDGAIVAFHAKNLEVAQLSKEAFSAIDAIDFASNQELAQAQDSLSQWNDEINSRVRSGNINFGIKSLTLNVTQICNLKCTYCAAGGDGSYGEAINKISIEKTLPQLKFFLDQLPNGSDFKISFIGGEPLLYPEALKAIYDYVIGQCTGRKISCQFSVTTNGTLITDKVIELFQNMKIHVMISLDGPHEINDKLRPNKSATANTSNKTISSTAATLAGIQKLNKIRSSLASIGITAVVNSENLDLVRNYLFLKELNVDWCEFNFSYSEKSQTAQKEHIRQMQKIAELAFKIGGEKELRKIKTFNTYFDVLDRQQRIENFCGAGKSYLALDANNKVYTCPWQVGRPGETVGSGVDLNHTSLAKYQKPLVELNNCQTCWARFVCGGGCMYVHEIHTGSKHKKSDLFCERTRSLLTLALLYYNRSRNDDRSESGNL